MKKTALSPTKKGPKKSKGRGRPTRRREGRSRGDGLRVCLGCNRAYPPASMLKIVAGPDGLAHIDGSGKLPGRGCHVYASSLCIKESVKRKRIARSLRVEGLDVQADRLLEEARLDSLRKIKNLLALAQKAGRMVSGSETVSRSLERGRLGFLMLALDASEATANRVAGWGRGQGVSLYHLPFTVDEFGFLIGKRPRAVAGVRFGELSKALEKELIKADQLRDSTQANRRCMFPS